MRVGRSRRAATVCGGPAGVLAGVLAVLALGGCSAQAPPPRPAAHTATPATPSPAAPATAPASVAASPSASAAAPAPRPAATAAPARPARATTAGHCATACSGSHHAPTAEDGLREDPGPRPTGQATGPGTHREPGTYVPGQDGPSVTAPVVLPGVTPTP